MSQPAIKNSKKIDQSRWVEFCDMITDGYRGQLISLEIIDPEIGDALPIKKTPLSAIVCDPADKGNDIVIETGKEQVNYAHTIAAPTEIWEAQDENGKLIALEIKAASGVQAIVQFLQ